MREWVCGETSGEGEAGMLECSLVPELSQNGGESLVSVLM